MRIKSNKKKYPLVSIIMNCYNGEKYLRKSIQSVINQKYKDWELIFFDNCSNDQSFSIAKSFNNKKIKLFKSKKYLKLYKARNTALKKTKGKLIAFLDVDDLWHHSKLKLQVEYMLKNKKNFVFSNYYLLKGNKKFKSGYLSLFREGYVTQSLLDNYWLGILTVLMKKKLFKKRKFNQNYEIIGDFDFFVNLSINNYFGYVEKPLAFYRVHNNNFSQIKIDLWIKELKSWIEKNSERFIKRGFNLSKQKKYLYKLKIKNFFNYINEKFIFKYI